MATIRKTNASRRHILHLASGKVGVVVVKQYGDKMVIANLPDMSRVKWSPKQKANNKALSRAQQMARYIHSVPALQEKYARLHDKSPRRYRSLYNFIVSREMARQKEAQSAINL